MEWVESTGRSIDDAKEAALDRLGVHEDEAEFDVLTDARVGLFGRVKEDARVRARVRPVAARAKEDRRRGRGRSRRAAAGDTTELAGAGSAATTNGSRGNEQREAGRGARRSRRSGRREPEGRDRERSEERGPGRDRSRRSQSEKSAPRRGEQREPSVSEHDTGPSLEEQAALAEEFVGGLAERFGLSLSFRRDELTDGVLRIEASGEDIGILVGRKGLTAQAIDDLVRTVLQRAGGTIREGKIRVDIGGVRARRSAFLAEFTRNVAEQVLDSGEEAVLEPMGGADRKIVHDVVNEIAGVVTRSEGEEPHRRVVISAAPDGE